MTFYGRMSDSQCMLAGTGLAIKDSLWGTRLTIKDSLLHTTDN